MKKNQMRFQNKEMEQEYQSQKAYSRRAKVTVLLFVIAFIITSSSIPAIVDANYAEFAISLGLIALFFILVLLERWSACLFQALFGISLISFNIGRLFFFGRETEDISRSATFLQGYAFASLQVILIAHFSELEQKLLSIIFSFVLRFICLHFLNSKTITVDVVFEHACVDSLVFFILFLKERNKRMAFQRSTKFRDEVMECRKNFTESLIQSTVIVSEDGKELYFANSASENLLNQLETSNEPRDSSLNPSAASFDYLLKPYLQHLKIDQDSIQDEEVLASVNDKNFTHADQLIQELIAKKIVMKKIVTFYSTCLVSGRECFFKVQAMKIKWIVGNAIGLVIVDVTEKKENSALKMLNINKDKAVVTIAHELRTPLNGILGILQLVEKSLSNSEALEYLNLCRDNANLLISLVNSLLDLDQLRNNKLKLNPVKVDIQKVLESVMRLFDFQYVQKEIQLNLKIEPDVPKFITTDENRLKQIIINLLGNALKFTSNGGVTINVAQDKINEELLQISVLDTGIGIKEDDLHRLFQRYGKLEDSTDMNQNGIGLGLMISDALAKLLAGRTDERRGLEVASQINIGTRFQFKVLKNLQSPQEIVKMNELSLLGTTPKSVGYNLTRGINYEESKEMDGGGGIGIPSEYSNESLISQSVHQKIANYTLNTHLIDFKLENSPNFETTSTRATLIPMNLHKLRNSPPKAISSRQELIENRFSTNILRAIKRTSKQKEKILVVDDNAFNLLVAQKIIEELGYFCKVAQSGEEAIEIIKCDILEPQPFTAVLMDCQMPGMDGFDTTKALNNFMDENEQERIPVVALTSNECKDDIGKCFESGMIGYLSKPLKISNLSKILNELK